MACEVNFDTLVGPTHHYGALSLGNRASMQSAAVVANPREAALQGLAKMRQLMQLGIKQGVLPPHPRPSIAALHALGFRGSDTEILAAASKADIRLLASCSSASSMWAANSATISPSADSADGRVHLTPANLVSNLHRAIEPPYTAQVLKQIFADERYFSHHPPLPSNNTLADEGSANHTRLAESYGKPGVQLFVYGRHALDRAAPTPKVYPARQTLEASQAIARHHLLEPKYVVFAQQNPTAIDAGVFHNDVIAVGNETLLLYHEQTFLDTPETIKQLQQAAEGHGFPITLYRVSQRQLSLEAAVKSYLFNSQIVTKPNRKMTLLAPMECYAIPETRAVLDAILASDNPVDEVMGVDLHQSMRNGGGPACVRLRAALTEEQLAAVQPSVLLTDELYHQLSAWIRKYYRDRLTLSDLSDPQLLQESREAQDALSLILQLRL